MDSVHMVPPPAPSTSILGYPEGALPPTSVLAAAPQPLVTAASMPFPAPVRTEQAFPWEAYESLNAPAAQSTQVLQNANLPTTLLYSQTTPPRTSMSGWLP